MGGLPDMLFVIDTNKEEIAIQEAKKLGIPVVAMLDSNSDPRRSAIPFPGNDDASRAIKLYCDLIAGAVLDGIQAEMSASGIDLGEHRGMRRGRAAERAAGRGAGGDELPPWPAARRPDPPGNRRGSRRRRLSGGRLTDNSEETEAWRYHGRSGQRAARADRRRHDGLQEGPGARPTATSKAPIDWLRKKGLAKAAKKAGRIAARA